MLAQRKGDWIQTYTGKQFWPLDPRPEDVCIEDIAHALSMKCRFGGHTNVFYSVAEHSVLVMRAVEEPHKKAALLHDAAEAYLADIPRPVKPHLPGWHEVERAVELAIAEHFGIPWPMPAEVKAADNAILHDEKRLLVEARHDWKLLGQPLGIDRFPLWPPFYAEKVFLSEFKRLAQ